MFIEPIQVIQSLDELNKAGTVKSSKASGEFQDVFQNLWNNVKDTREEHAYQEYLLSTGQVDDPHTVMIAGTKAEMAVELLVQMRNKALESYDQLIKTSL